MLAIKTFIRVSSLAERCMCCSSVGGLALLDVTFRNFLVWHLYVLPFQALPHLCLCAWNHSTNILAHSCPGTLWLCDSGCPGADSSCPLINKALMPTPQPHQKKISRKMWTSTDIIQTFAPQIGILIFLILGNEILLSQTSQSCLSFENAIIINSAFLVGVLAAWASISEHPRCVVGSSTPSFSDRKEGSWSFPHQPGLPFCIWLAFLVFICYQLHKIYSMLLWHTSGWK